MRILFGWVGVAAVCFAQSSYFAEGRVIGGGNVAGVSVEVSDGGGKMSMARAPVHADSSFRIELPGSGQSLEFRIEGPHGEVIQTSHQWPQRGVPIELRLPEGSAGTSSQAAISFRRLSFRPSSKLRQAFAASQKLKSAGRKAESMAALRQIVKTEPAWFEAWVELGTGQAVQGESSAAVDSLRKAMVIDPNAAEVYPFLGFALLSSGQIPEAGRIAKLGLELKPDCLKSKYILGLSMAMEREPSTRAVDLLAEAQAEFPEAMVPLASLLLRLGQYEASRDAAWRYLHMSATPRAELAGLIWREASRALLGRAVD